MKKVNIKKQPKSIKNLVCILVIYTFNKIEKLGYEKRYAFNVDKNSVKIGDMLNSPNYSTPMQVVKILDRPYKYFNKENGDLSDTFHNSNQFEVRQLEIVDDYATTITARKIK